MPPKLSEKITPVQLAKRLEIRPQQVFNWIKQGCPAERLGGKWYVNEAAVEEWREGRAEAKKERTKEAAQKRSQQDKVGIEAAEALLHFKPQQVEHWCGNCEKVQPFLVDLMFVGEPIDNYVKAYCFECRLNHRLQANIPNEAMKQVLLEGRPLWVPCENGDVCDCRKDHSHELTTLDKLRFCETCGYTEDTEDLGEIDRTKTSSGNRALGIELEPDPEDVHPYVPTKEDLEAAADAGTS